jgi:ribosomal protein S18 acetylase RimI-like enzyme
MNKPSMTDILRETTPERLTQAIEDNALHFYITQAESPLIHLEHTADHVRMQSEVKFPIGNVITRAKFSGTDEEIREKVHLALNPFRAHQLPLAWIIDTQGTPPNLGGYLIAEGLYRVPDVPGMAAEITSLHSPHPTQKGLVIERVENEMMLEAWVNIFHEVFGLPDYAADFWQDSLASLGLEADKPLRHYLALLDGKVVGTSSLLVGAGVAGIYNVATIQEVRGRGIGTALTLQPLQIAQQEGYHIAILQSSDMALDLYRKIGFKQYCRFEAYIWTGF